MGKIVKTNLNYKLERLSKYFDLEKISQFRADGQYIDRYYKVNKIPYTILHSSSNFVHMGVTKGEEYSKDD